MRLVKTRLLTNLSFLLSSSFQSLGHEVSPSAPSFFPHSASRLTPVALSCSIHKSQGQTIACVKVDLGKVFEKGQSYVALSRATSLEGLQVLNFDAKKVLAHQKVIDWSVSSRSFSRSFARPFADDTLIARTEIPHDPRRLTPRGTAATSPSSLFVFLNRIALSSPPFSRSFCPLSQYFSRNRTNSLQFPHSQRRVRLRRREDKLRYLRKTREEKRAKNGTKTSETNTRYDPANVSNEYTISSFS